MAVRAVRGAVQPAKDEAGDTDGRVEAPACAGSLGAAALTREDVAR
ncbi:hypothetical protein [Streptomyces sp. NPDC056527]